ncbi:glycerophosphodiester phosphodiesterase [Streptomyces sp. SCUT-3]|uniref:glycerophosphodiester phosphodiesterase n=1 Tax=Streptomyces sp. SCUT-3 TaxID=2684469 RepID=UPI0015F9DAA5|nr:glycerophosphodiester phosphodiesterase [Streptomyces sp. SCUT-3]QMV24446.1 glycerophosphodiester phosphodiesterase [Streptomyces sp. SCUT-3]
MTNARHPYLARTGPLLFAHRGGTADGLENSLHAFRRAASLGYRYLETDVHTTADGELVAFHDTTLDRVTDGRGRIADLTWEQVSRARIAGREPVPRFADLLRELPQAHWNVDAKTDAALVPLLEEIERAGAWDRVCVGSFSEARVARARSLAGPRLATSLGTRAVAGLRLLSRGGRMVPPRLLGEAALRGAVCVQVPERHAGVRVVDAAFVRTAHHYGLQVHVWTVNEADRVHRLLDLGVDGIMTDDLEMLLRVADDRAR